MLLCALDKGVRLKGHIHILGICGTFMGGIALLARELGYKVTGSDAEVKAAGCKACIIYTPTP